MAQADYVTNAIRALITGATKSTRQVRAAHTEFVATLAGHSPRPIPVDAEAIGPQDRADRLNKVLSASSVNVAAILNHTAQNVPGGREPPHIDDVLFDLASNVTGTIQHASDGMAGRVE